MASKPPKPPTDKIGDNITQLKGKTAKNQTLKQDVPVSLQAQSWLLMLEQTDDDRFAQRVIEQLIKLYDKITDPILQTRLLSSVILITENEKSRDWAAERMLQFAKVADFDDKLELLSFVHVADVGDKVLDELAEQVDLLMETNGPADFIVYMSNPETYYSPVVAEFLADLFLVNAQYMHNQYMVDYAELLLLRSEILTEDASGKVAALLIHMTGDDAGLKIVASNPELQELLDEVIEADAETEETVKWQNLVEEASDKPTPGKLVRFTGKKKKPETSEEE